MASHGYVYELLRDQGSFIAGILALIAGAMAYLSGRTQAHATRESAARQVSAILEQKNQAHQDSLDHIQALEWQIAERNREAAELERKGKIETVRMLTTETARIHRFARDRLAIAEKRYSNAPDHPVHKEIAPFRIEARDILNRVGVLEFKGTGIMPAATHLQAMVDVLDSALESAGLVSELQGAALMGHLNNIIDSAERLKTLLENWEINNPVPQ